MYFDRQQAIDEGLAVPVDELIAAGWKTKREKKSLKDITLLELPAKRFTLLVEFYLRECQHDAQMAFMEDLSGRYNALTVKEVESTASFAKRAQIIAEAAAAAIDSLGTNELWNQIAFFRSLPDEDVQREEIWRVMPGRDNRSRLPRKRCKECHVVKTVKFGFATCTGYAGGCDDVCKKCRRKAAREKRELLKLDAVRKAAEGIGQYKPCKQCGKVKHLLEFYKSSNNRDQRTGKCKECLTKQRKYNTRRKAAKEEVKEK
jgi:hypothetical protein